MKPKSMIVAISAVLVMAACSGTASSTTTTPALETTTEPTAAPATAEETVHTEVAELAMAGAVATVSGSQSGNRVLAGSSNVFDQKPVDIPLGGTPVWIVGVTGSALPTWVVANDNGAVAAWRLGTSGPESIAVTVASLPPGTPPLVAVAGDEVTVVPPPAAASPLTYPALVDGAIVYIASDGDLVIARSDQTVVLEVGALPDSRISVGANGLVSVLAEPTSRYPHGVLGDRLEAGRIVIVDPEAGSIVGEALVAEPDVIEGIAAPWLDADGDGVEELLVTVSNGDYGARLAIFDRDGDLVAESRPIGRANRWRNQLGAGPIGPNGETEVVDVLVPHIGGVVEYFRIEGAELVQTAQQGGFTSHVYGSRNLDMALAADVTGDGRLDVLVPTQDLEALGVLARTGDGVSAVAEWVLPGRLTTNVAGTTLADGGVAIAVGTSEGILRVYTSG